MKSETSEDAVNCIYYISLLCFMETLKQDATGNTETKTTEVDLFPAEQAPQFPPF